MPVLECVVISVHTQSFTTECKCVLTADVGVLCLCRYDKTLPIGTISCVTHTNKADGAQKHQRAGRCSSGDEGEEEEEGSCTRWHTELHCRAIPHRVLRDVESVYTGLGSTNVGQPDQGKCKDFQKVCWLFVYVELGSISERVTLFLF